MRHTRRTVPVAMAVALIKHGQVSDAFGALLPTCPAKRTIQRFLRTPARVGSTRHSRPTTSTLLHVNREAAEVDDNKEHVFPGGAEEIAERVTRGCDDGAGVFYNRVAAVSRDIGVLMANVLAEERSKEREAKKRRGQIRTPLFSSPVGDPAQPGAARTSNGGDVSTTELRAHAAEEKEHRKYKEEEEEEGLVVLDAFAASGVRALRCVCCVPCGTL